MLIFFLKDPQKINRINVFNMQKKQKKHVRHDIVNLNYLKQLSIEIFIYKNKQSFFGYIMLKIFCLIILLYL